MNLMAFFYIYFQFLLNGKLSWGRLIIFFAKFLNTKQLKSIVMILIIKHELLIVKSLTCQQLDKNGYESNLEVL